MKPTATVSATPAPTTAARGRAAADATDHHLRHRSRPRHRLRRRRCRAPFQEGGDRRCCLARRQAHWSSRCLRPHYREGCRHPCPCRGPGPCPCPCPCRGNDRGARSLPFASRDDAEVGAHFPGVPVFHLVLALLSSRFPWLLSHQPSPMRLWHRLRGGAPCPCPDCPCLFPSRGPSRGVFPCPCPCPCPCRARGLHRVPCPGPCSCAREPACRRRSCTCPAA